MAKLNLSRSPDIVAAIAILDNGKEIALIQRSHRSGELSLCLFFEKFPFDGFEIQLRLDYSEISENGDPTLDADIYKGGEKYVVDRDKWHHTARALVGDEWLYDWEFRDYKLRFKVQTTNQKHQSAKAFIAAAPVNLAPISAEEAQRQAIADEKLKSALGVPNTGVAMERGGGEQDPNNAGIIVLALLVAGVIIFFILMSSPSTDNTTPSSTQRTDLDNADPSIQRMCATVFSKAASQLTVEEESWKNTCLRLAWK